MAYGGWLLGEEKVKSFNISGTQHKRKSQETKGAIALQMKKNKLIHLLFSVFHLGVEDVEGCVPKSSLRSSVSSRRV
jgi:hypothetical protein